MNFYSVIIGSELLNGRRVDKHFNFFNKELLKRGWKHKASYIINDEPEFIESTFKFIQNDPQSVLFSFGGIGSTPDDYTRNCAANVFTNGIMEKNKEAIKCILERFGEDAYPHRILMGSLPTGANLLSNPVSNVPGFYLQNRFFFVPCFPQMAQPMIIEALEKHYPKNKQNFYRFTISARSSENAFIDIMKSIDKKVNFSSLPILDGDKRYTVLSIASENKMLAMNELQKFVNYCNDQKIEFYEGDIKTTNF